MVLLAESSEVDPASLAAPLRDVVRSLDPNLPIYNVRTMETLYRMRAIRVFNVLITTVASMGVMGLGLAIVGLYGVSGYALERGTRVTSSSIRAGVVRAVLRRVVMRPEAGLIAVG